MEKKYIGIIGGIVGGIIITAIVIGRIIGGWIGTAVTVAILVAFATLLLKGITAGIQIIRVPFGEVWAIDRAGELIIKKPGYRMLVPIFGFEKILGKIVVGRETFIKLFEEEEEIRIGLARGGEVMLRDPRIWYYIENEKKAKQFIQFAVDPIGLIREMAESLLSGRINQMDHEMIYEMRAAPDRNKRITDLMRYEVRFQGGKIALLTEEETGFLTTIKKMGAEFRGVTISDFDLDPETLRKRNERIQAEMDVDIAKQGVKRAQQIAEAEREETKAILLIAQDLIKGGFPEAEARQIAPFIYRKRLAAQKGTLVEEHREIVWSGESATIPAMMAQAKLGGEMLGEGKGRKQRKEEYYTQGKPKEGEKRKKTKFKMGGEEHETEIEE